MIYIDYRGLCDIYNNVVEVSGGGASGKVDNFLLKDIIQSIIYEDDFSEELKLQLIDAII